MKSFQMLQPVRKAPQVQATLAVLAALVFALDVHAGTEMISVAASPAAIVHDGNSAEPELSGDGRFLVYSSVAANIVPGDDNGRRDVFLFDSVTQVHQRISAQPDGTSLAGTDSASPTISIDGRFITLRSGDAFLPGTGGGRYLYDRLTGMRELLSIPDDEALGPPIVLGQDIGRPVSDDARFTCFSTASSGLAGNDHNQASDVFLRDRVNGTTRLVSVATTGDAGNLGSYGCSVSNDGRFVAFTSAADDLIVADGNASEDVFIRDLLTGMTRRVSQTHAGAEIVGHSRLIEMNGDASWLVIVTDANGVVPADQNGVRDTFAIRAADGFVRPLSVDLDGTPSGFSARFYRMHGHRIVLGSALPLLPGESIDYLGEFAYLIDLTTQQTQNLTAQLPGHAPNQQFVDATISADLSTFAFVTRHRFETATPNSWPNDSLYRLDRLTQGLQLPSLTGQIQVAGDNHSGGLPAAVDASGRWVVFSSGAGNLDESIIPGQGHTYLRDRALGTTVRLDPAPGLSGPCGMNRPGLSADARFVVLVRCIPGAGTITRTVVRLDRTSGQEALVSATAAGEPADGSAWDPTLSADGRHVVFASIARNLAPGAYAPGRSVLFAKDMTTGAVRRITGGDGIPEPGFVYRFRLSEEGRWLLLDQGAQGSLLVDLGAAALTAVRVPLTPLGSLPTELASGTGRVLSGDAQRLAFSAMDPTLGGAAGRQVYLSHLPARTFELVSKDDAGQPFFQASMPSISLDARFVAFQGQRTSVEPNRVFVRDRACNRLIAVTQATVSGGQTVDFRAVALSGDGTRMTFDSNQPDLVAGDWNHGLFDTFLSQGYLLPDCQTQFADGFE